VLSPQSGTPSWGVHVGHGQRLDLEIFATNSLLVLRANGVKLALDNHYPRGETHIFDLDTNICVKSSVPKGIVIRQLDEMPALPGLAEAIQAREREVGTGVTIYALYPENLYAVLKSLTYQAIKNTGISPEAVRRADVELRAAGGTSFIVELGPNR